MHEGREEHGRSKESEYREFQKRIGNTTYRVRVHFPQNTKRTFTDSVNTLIMNECTSKKK
ncbi:transposon-encoded TnpW family protein [Enterobacter kobei]|uniref:transposon-encoded TnpW family protein n=1 Tax=Enterobacter kobei TaxID=208224 RepID=UPI0037096239